MRKIIFLVALLLLGASCDQFVPITANYDYTIGTSTITTVVHATPRQGDSSVTMATPLLGSFSFDGGEVIISRPTTTPTTEMATFQSYPSMTTFKLNITY